MISDGDFFIRSDDDYSALVGAAAAIKFPYDEVYVCDGQEPGWLQRIH
jgi:hypothetical protein